MNDITHIIHRLAVEEGDAGIRLDKFLALHLPEFSRSRLKALIEQGQVAREDGTSLRDPSGKVKPGEQVTMTVPPPEPAEPIAQAIPLDILFEDDALLVINKPAGLTVHPAPGSPDHTLVNALLAHCGDSLSGIGGIARPGIVHRLDKDTSGLIAVAKTDAAHHALSAQLAERTMKRTYQAIVWGTPVPASGTIEGNIGRSPRDRKKMAVVPKGGKAAVTHYVLRETFGLASHVECKLQTGRTHQIRVHMAHLGHALLGDPLYGKRTPKQLPDELSDFIEKFNRQALHASMLQFRHPKTHEEQCFTSPLPEDMQCLLNILSPLK